MHLFELLFRNAGTGIALVGSDGVPLRVNNKLCSLLGYPEEQLLQMPFGEFTHPEDQEKDLGLFHQLLAGEIDSYEIEKRYIRCNGEVFWALLTVSVGQAVGEPTMVIGVVQDIDRKKSVEQALLKSEEQLRQHNAYKDRLLSIIAHDLRGPVGSIAMILDFLEQDSVSLSKERILELVSKVKQTATRTSELLDNLLSWSESQFRSISYEPLQLPLLQAVRRVTGLLRQQAESKQVKLQVLIPQDIEVYADEQMLHVILRNLVSNAIKFSQPGQTVQIEAWQVAGHTHISVSDKGVGIEARKLALLMEEGTERVSTYGTRGEKGTGLGLSLCRSYINQHGGRLKIESKASQGSRFSFSLPLLSAAASPLLAEVE